MTPEHEYYLELGQGLHAATESQLFGKPCFKVGGKAFICFFQNEMVFKLRGEAHRDALSMDGAQRFDPSGKGRPMKEWVQVPFDYKVKWQGYAQEAMDYVGGKPA